ncbi:MAG TPA: peptidylprolyl isomerase [Methanomicrobia archaeon]|nr:peptidylprolyl isomerase [Methanomicrobia archaeon]
MQKGDFVEIDYVAKIAETDQVFDTTMEDKARKYKIYKENFKYEPIRVVVGAEYVIKGMDEALFKMNVGEEKTIEVPPEKGFGRRDPKLIVKVPLREFRKHNITPKPGIRIEINGRWATVRNVNSGRVNLDFNHFLAGKTLIYDIKINSKIEDIHEKIKILMKLNIGSELRYDLKDGLLEVEERKNIDNILKDNLIKAVKEYIPEIKEVKYVKELKKEKSEA